MFLVNYKIDIFNIINNYFLLTFNFKINIIYKMIHFLVRANYCIYKKGWLKAFSAVILILGSMCKHFSKKSLKFQNFFSSEEGRSLGYSIRVLVGTSPKFIGFINIFLVILSVSLDKKLLFSSNKSSTNFPFFNNLGFNLPLFYIISFKIALLVPPVKQNYPVYISYIVQPIAQVSKKVLIKI